MGVPVSTLVWEARLVYCDSLNTSVLTVIPSAQILYTKWNKSLARFHSMRSRHIQSSFLQIWMLMEPRFKRHTTKLYAPWECEHPSSAISSRCTHLVVFPCGYGSGGLKSRPTSIIGVKNCGGKYIIVTLSTTPGWFVVHCQQKPYNLSSICCKEHGGICLSL